MAFRNTVPCLCLVLVVNGVTECLLQVVTSHGRRGPCGWFTEAPPRPLPERNVYIDGGASLPRAILPRIHPSLFHSSFIHNLLIEKSCALDEVLGTEVEKEEIDKIPSSLKLSSTTKAKPHNCVWGLHVSMYLGKQKQKQKQLLTI